MFGPRVCRFDCTTTTSILPPKGPLKEASKFAQQLSGAVNEKVMGAERSNVPAGDTPDVGMGMGTEAPWEGAEEAAAAAAAAAGGATGVGMAKGWQPPTSEPGMGMAKELELANDVPSELDAVKDTSGELSIDEQVFTGGGFEAGGLDFVGASRGAPGVSSSVCECVVDVPLLSFSCRTAF